MEGKMHYQRKDKLVIWVPENPFPTFKAKAGDGATELSYIDTNTKECSRVLGVSPVCKGGWIM